jgi:hypothetical protein
MFLRIVYYEVTVFLLERYGDKAPADAMISTPLL